MHTWLDIFLKDPIRSFISPDPLYLRKVRKKLAGNGGVKLIKF